MKYPIVIHKDPSSDYSGWTSGTTVTFFTKGVAAIRQMNIYHEFGHVLDNLPGLKDVFSSALGAENNPSYVDDSGQLDSKVFVERTVSDPNYGVAEALQHPSTDPKEQWADIFANYVALNIDVNSDMGLEMYNFVTGVLGNAIWP